MVAVIASVVEEQAGVFEGVSVGSFVEQVVGVWRGRDKRAKARERFVTAARLLRPAFAVMLSLFRCMSFWSENDEGKPKAGSNKFDFLKHSKFWTVQNNLYISSSYINIIFLIIK